MEGEDKKTPGVPVFKELAVMFGSIFIGSLLANNFLQFAELVVFTT